MKRSFTLYRHVGYRFVQGWLEPEVLDIVRVLNAAQCDHGVSGGVAEIGVHHGRFLIGLRLLGSPALAIDVFGDQHLNVDESGCGDLNRFMANASRWASVQELVIHQGDSTELTDAEIRQLVGPIRLFSVDGGHTERTVLSDMRLAECSLADGGIVIGDDVFNERWPEVSVATLRYLHDGKLVPFCIGFNKVFFSQPEYADVYRQALSTTCIGGISFDVTYSGHGVTLLRR